MDTIEALDAPRLADLRLSYGRKLILFKFPRLGRMKLFEVVTPVTMLLVVLRVTPWLHFLVPNGCEVQIDFEDDPGTTEIQYREPIKLGHLHKLRLDGSDDSYRP